MRLRLLACAFLLSAPLFAADPELLSLAMPDSQVLAGVSVDQAMLSPLGQFLMTRVTETSGNELQKFIEETGFDPRHDLREILVSLKGQPGSNSAIVLARGTFDIPKLLAMAPKDVTVETYKDVSILEKSQQEAFAFLDSTFGVFGELKDVRATIDRKTAPTAISSSMAVEVNRLSTTEDAWFVSMMPLSQLQPHQAQGGPNPMAVLEKVKQVSGGVKFGASVVATIGAVADTAENASMLAGLIKMGVSMGLSNHSNPQMAQAAELLKSLNVSSNGTAIDISWSMPEAQLEQMIQAAQAGAAQAAAVKPKSQAPPKAASPDPAQEGAAPMRIRVGGNVQKAKLLQQTAPVYPPLAVQAKITGVVTLNVIVATDGTVKNLTVVSGHPLLVVAAVQAVKQYVYQPTLLNGKPVEVASQVEVKFALDQ